MANASPPCAALIAADELVLEEPATLRELASTVPDVAPKVTPMPEATPDELTNLGFAIGLDPETNSAADR